MTRTIRFLTLAALLAASRASAATVLFSTLQPDGSETVSTLVLADDGGPAGAPLDVVHDPALWLGTAHPRLSPDRTKVLFRAYDPAQAQGDRLLVVAAAGGARVDITPGAPVASLLSGASWTTDGARALVVGALENPNGRWPHEIFSVPVVGGSARQLTFDGDGGSKYYPVMSPDGRWIAYVWEQPNPDPSAASAYVLAILPAGGGRARVLDTNVAKGEAPSWSKDSRFIAYARFDASRTYTDVYRVEIPTGDRRNLTLGRFQGQGSSIWQGSIMSPAFSPDGSRVAFVYVPGVRPDAGERGDLYVIGASGGAATKLNGTTMVATSSIDMGLAWQGPTRVLFPYVDSDAVDVDPTDSVSPAWPWNEGLASATLGGAVTKPLYGPLFAGQVTDVSVR